MSEAPDHAVSIRRADHTDIPVISTLANAIWPDAYGSILSPGQIRYMLQMLYTRESLEQQMADQHIFLLALMNAETVGFVSYSHDHIAGVYKIHKLYVHPLLHGKGFGKKLLDAVLEAVREQKAEAVRLNVNRHNKAVAFYKRCGFSIIGEEDIAIGEEYFMNDYMMEKKLSPTPDEKG